MFCLYYCFGYLGFMFSFGAGGWFVYQKFFYRGVRSNIIIRDDHVNLNSKSIERTFQSNPDAMILII